MGDAKSLRHIDKFIREHPDAEDEELEGRFPIYKHASDCQGRLKEEGDWVIFPRTLRDIAKGLYEEDEKGRIHYNGKHIPEGQLITVND